MGYSIVEYALTLLEGITPKSTRFLSWAILLNIKRLFNANPQLSRTFPALLTLC